MSTIPRQIAQLGIFLAVLVIFADAFFAPYPTLQWLALGVIFLFMAGWTIALLMHETIPSSTKKHPPNQGEDELNTLEEAIDVAINRSDPGGAEVLSERIRSIALSSLASALDLPESEIRALAEQQQKELDMMTRDSDLRDLRDLVIAAKPGQLGSIQGIESLIGKLEAASA